MKHFTIFCHSLVSDWNHGNAHFLRGICTGLLHRGHAISVYEPRGNWSLSGLRADCGDAPLAEFGAAFPQLRSSEYDLGDLNLESVLAGSDVVVVHEWNDPELVRRIGEHRHAMGGYVLLFHDTHHRSVTDPEAMAAYDLRYYDGVLAFGESIRCRYLANNWARRIWTWHEAADTTVFYPREPQPFQPRYDLVWIGNWGDDERAAELQEFLINPVKELGLRACIHGVRYPEHARQALQTAGIEYRGWLPNARVPQLFAQARFTVHVPRRPYTQALPGIPTIRVFEALACRIPLISAPWRDCESLFEAGRDFMYAADGAEMKRHMLDVLDNPDAALRRAEEGLRTLQARHTCAHRVEQLERICEELT